MGRGYSFATCLEGALKIKELTYIHSEGKTYFNFLELIVRTFLDIFVSLSCIKMMPLIKNLNARLSQLFLQVKLVIDRHAS